MQQLSFGGRGLGIAERLNHDMSIQTYMTDWPGNIPSMHCRGILFGRITRNLFSSQALSTLPFRRSSQSHSGTVLVKTASYRQYWWTAVYMIGLSTCLCAGQPSSQPSASIIFFNRNCRTPRTFKSQSLVAA